MKTREQIYGQEAAGLLRDVSMYRALTEMQLLKLYPHKESKIRNLLSYLQKQGRIVQRGEYYRIPADAEESIDHGLSKAVWVLTDFMEPRWNIILSVTIPPKSSFLRMVKFTRSFMRSRVKSSLSTKCSPR